MEKPNKTLQPDFNEEILLIEEREQAEINEINEIENYLF